MAYDQRFRAKEKPSIYSSAMLPGSVCHIFHSAFNGQAMMLIAPVAVILVAKPGHLKVADDRTQYGPVYGRAFVGDGLATMLSGSVGGSGVTTYAENIGVMAVTKVYRRWCLSLLPSSPCCWAFTEIWR